VHRFAVRPVLIGDGINIPMSGHKMLVVKLLHQESKDNTTPEYSMGHSIQVVSVLAVAGVSFFAAPLAVRVHEAVKFSNRNQTTLPQKFGDLLDSLAVGEPFYLVADAYYACQQLVLRLQRSSSYLNPRVRRRLGAYHSLSHPDRPHRSGHPVIPGTKLSPPGVGYFWLLVAYHSPRYSAL
jgi:hypothetical protein